MFWCLAVYFTDTEPHNPSIDIFFAVNNGKSPDSKGLSLSNVLSGVYSREAEKGALLW